MGRYEVTQGEWQALMVSNPSYFKNAGARAPVEQVSWNDSRDMLGVLNQRIPGGGFRLPTEAEWEYAARGGLVQQRFPWGDELEPGGRPDAPEPGPAMLGDIVLCPEFAAGQAEAAGHTLGQELALLTVHGVLHLLGYDHAEPDEEKEMFALQRQLLEEWVADQVEAYHYDRQNEKDQRLLDKSRYFDQP